MPVKKQVKPKDKTVKMTRRGIVVDAPERDVQNMLKNGWVKA